LAAPYIEPDLIASRPSPQLRAAFQFKETTMLKSACIAASIVLGTAAIANGAFMLIDPERWYYAVPGVTTTGLFNQHFVRDIGLIFLLVGGVRPNLRIVSWAAPSIWLSGHALFHFWEVAVGICGPSVLARDFPAVTLPALIGLAITIWAITDSRKATAAGTVGRSA